MIGGKCITKANIHILGRLLMKIYFSLPLGNAYSHMIHSTEVLSFMKDMLTSFICVDSYVDTFLKHKYLSRQGTNNICDWIWENRTRCHN